MPECSLLFKLCKENPVKDIDAMLRRAITEIKVVTALHLDRAAQGKVLSHQCGEYSLHVLFNSLMNMLESLVAHGSSGTTVYL